MRVVWLLCLVAALTDDGVMGELSPPDKSYKILVPIPMIGRSHWNMFKPLLEALALRGHQIVTMHPLPPKLHNPNITELFLPNVGISSPSNHFEGTTALAGGFHLLKEPLTIAATRFYTLPEVKQYYSKRKEFDLIITDHLFNETSQRGVKAKITKGVSRAQDVTKEFQELKTSQEFQELKTSQRGVKSSRRHKGVSRAQDVTKGSFKSSRRHKEQC
ncbi:uncharacterized protein LOC121853822 [Homarus americanus]|uniref:uncharacterized protein LOC121853822 n=1 Tax=Homarus americanus TaxID=6706 RepID=UPI001C49503A|nr:uncharacterized protein LOC121853822 [Homarus americanus]